MEVKEKNKRLLIVVGVLLLFGGISLAYFVSKAILGGNGGSTSVTTAVIKGATLNVEGVLSFEDLDILPGHKTVSGIKVTATGNNELIPYNLIWQGTNTLTTPLNFTIYKTSEEINTTSTCNKKSKQMGASKALLEECTISNLDKLGSEIASGTINKNETKVNLVKDEFITATSTGDIKYYYIILEYPNLDEPQNEDLNGTFEGEVTVEESNIKPDINILAAYVVQDDGTYKQVEDIPQSGYQLNKDKSTCTNSAVPGWDIKNHRFYVDNLTTRGTNCNLYFDKYVPTAGEKILANVTVNEGTPDFSKVATTDEGVFKAEDGMYGGISYYWRGAATTNHVIFANKCWRIVRINGDGSIRLIYNGAIQSNNSCHGNGSWDESVVMGSTNAEKYYATSDGKDDNSSYVGWTYTLSSQWPSENETDSNAKMQTEEWYKTNITNKGFAGKVVDGYFCNDRTVQAPVTWGTGFVTEWSATGTRFAHGGVKRIWEDFNPTFGCINSKDIYLLKVGAITVDEAEFAGGRPSVANDKYYLYNGNNYWTMSPTCWFNNSASVFYVTENGALSYFEVDRTNVGLRPVINLRSDVTFSDGDGTLNNPYIVEGA